MDVCLAACTQQDGEDLAQIRVDAMRDSLSSLGRFDAQRARNHFIDTFDHHYCRRIVVDRMLAGVVSMRSEKSHRLIDHFYIVPAFQRRGVGSTVLRRLMTQADDDGLPIVLGTLDGSAANRFYQRHGFVRSGRNGVDIHYVRRPLALLVARGKPYSLVV